MTEERLPVLSRRRVLGGTVAGVAMLAGCAGGGGSGGGGQTATEEPYDGWLSPVQNFDGTVADRTGAENVSITVGAGNGLLYDPPAVRVTPGTTVLWEWTGRGGQHNVQEETGAFESELASAAGTTFEWTASEPGVYRYFCLPHQRVGMQGVVDVVEG